MAPSTRDKLIEGAIACIQEQGMGATTTRDIAARAGVPLASIPYHFGTKEALLDEALAVALERWRRHILDVSASRDDALGVFGSALGGMLATLPDVRQLAIMLQESHMRAMRDGEFRVALARFRRSRLEVASAQLAAYAAALGSEIDADAAAAVGLAFMDGVIVQWLLDPDLAADPARMLTALRQLLDLRPPDDRSSDGEKS